MQEHCDVRLEIRGHSGTANDPAVADRDLVLLLAGLRQGCGQAILLLLLLGHRVQR